MEEKLVVINREEDGAIGIQFFDEKPHEEALAAISMALVCGITEASDGLLDAKNRLLNVFSDLDNVLMGFYADGTMLSDEDIDKIMEMITDDPT